MSEYFSEYTEPRMKKKDNTITGTDNNGDAMVYGAVVIPWNDNKIHTWKFKVIEGKGLWGSAIIIGINEANQHQLDKCFCKQITTINYGYHSYDGKMYHSGTSSKYGEAYKNGDIITMKLDMFAKRIKFAKNAKWFSSKRILNGNKKNIKYKMAVYLPYYANSICLLSYVCNDHSNEQKEQQSMKNTLEATLKISMEERISYLEKHIISLKQTIQSTTDQNYKYKTANTSLENEKNELKNAKNALKTANDSLNEQINQSKHEKNRLKNTTEQITMEKHGLIKEKQILQTTNQSLNQQIKMLKNEISQLNMKLMEEQKENQLLINDLKQEIHELKLKNLDCSKYFEWESEDILQWILTIENGRYLKYEQVLRESLKEEDVKGIHLQKVDSSDVKGWGVKQFDDKKDLTKSIQNLIQQNQPNQQKNIVLNEGAPTAYI